ncbi:MAG: polymorphic toxin-type HINT domain-containing protein [Arcicella sp.]|nr:polymorphic toxin-type HINT domain-containing protein [Arcicella sp.]
MLFLPAGTPITVKQNNHKALRNIELIVAGDEVGGYDHKLKKFAWGVVKGTKKSIKRGLVALFAAGTLIAQPTLEHPVWTENHHDYVAAQDLKVGDTFLDGKGATLRLDSLVVKPDTTLTVYNFEVENLHNYYVGTQEVLVHNECITLRDLAGKLAPPLSPEAATTLIRDFENSFVRSGISRVERTNFYEQILDNLNKNKLDVTDVSVLLTEFNSGSISREVKQYLAKNISERLVGCLENY